MFNLPLPEFSITIVIFYWAYLVLVGFYCLIALLNLYHLVRFGFFSFVNISVILIFCAVSVWLISFSFTILAGFYWDQPIFNPSWFLDLKDMLGNTLGSSLNKIIK